MSAAELSLDAFLGQVGVVEYRESNDRIRNSGEEVSRLQVRIYAARDRREKRVIVREYSGENAFRVVADELNAHTRLPASCTVQLRAQIFDLNPSDPTLIEAWIANLRCDPPEENALFLVFDAIGPSMQYAASLGFPSQQKFFQFFSWQQNQNESSRYQEARGLCRAALRSLAIAHEAGVAHGSLGLGALVLAPDRILLDFFGFQQTTSIPNMKADLRALGIALFELVFGYMAQAPVDGNTLRTLYEDVFQLDPISFSEYATDFQTEWIPGLTLLQQNDYAGFHFFQALFSGSSSVTLTSTRPALANNNNDDDDNNSFLSLLTARGLLSSSPFFSDLPHEDDDTWLMESVRAGLDQDAIKRRRNV